MKVSLLISILSTILGSFLSSIISLYIFSRKKMLIEEFNAFKSLMASLEDLKFVSYRSFQSKQLLTYLTGGEANIKSLIREVIRLSGQVKFLYCDKIKKLLDKYQEDLLKIELETDDIYSACYPEDQPQAALDAELYEASAVHEKTKKLIENLTNQYKNNKNITRIF